MSDENPFEIDESIPPEHVLEELQWCKKEVGYAKTETEGTPRRRLKEVFNRLKQIQDTLDDMEEVLE